MAEGSGWCTIESDPGVFTEMLTSIGVRGVQVEELYSLDRDALRSLEPIHGLVFLFHYGGEVGGYRAGELCDPAPSGMFFARQVITNACATQAILSIVLNARAIDTSESLKSLRSFCTSIDSVSAGMALSNSAEIRDAHNSFAPPMHFALDEQATATEDAFHFVSYIPFNGHLYELDGLQPGPRDHGACDKDSWLDLAATVLTARIAAFAASEIRFNLLAITDDMTARYRTRVAALQDANLPAELAAAEDALAAEQRKRERWRRENARRRCNFLPFIVEALKFAASEGALDDAVKTATEEKQKALRDAEAAKTAGNNSDATANPNT